jgi:transposase
MDALSEALPDDINALRAALIAERAARQAAEQQLSGAAATIAHLRLMITKLQRDKFGASSERGKKLLDQFELQLEELEATQAEDASAAETAQDNALPSERRKPVRGPLPDHLPRERVIIDAPVSCPCCGGTRLTKLGESVTETLEVIPRQWKVVQTVREKFSCRDCETITQPPAPFHPIARGRAGPNLLATILEQKFGQHLPLNRLSERFAQEGVEIDTSTLADWVGACTATLAPLTELVRAHVLAAERLHGDDTTVPVLAKTKTTTGRLWVYVRDDRPFAGPAPPAAFFRYSPDRSGKHPRQHLADYSGILQADAYGGYAELYAPVRQPGPILEAGCWAHARRNFYELAQLRQAPLAAEAVRQIDTIFAAERAINGGNAEERLGARQTKISPLVEAFEGWMRAQRPNLSRHAELAKAMDYMLKRWPSFARFIEDGRICISNNAAERALRGIALGRKAWLFAGSDRGGERAAAIYSLIVTAKLNDVDPHAWLADMLRRINDQPVSKLYQLLPWNWKK